MSRANTFHFWNSVGEDITHPSGAQFRRNNDNNNNNLYTSSGREAEGTHSGEVKSDFSTQSTVTSIKNNSNLQNWGHNSIEQIARFESFRDVSPASVNRGSLLLSDLVARESPSVTNMSSNYLSSSKNAQAEALQTLYLMDQGTTYNGGYGNPPNQNSMRLSANGGSLGGVHINSFGNSNHHHHQNHHQQHLQQHPQQHPQQHQSFLGSLNSAALPLPHQPHQVMPVPNTDHHNSCMPQTSHLYNNWAGVNGISLFPSGGGGHEEEGGNLPIATRVVADPASHLSAYGSATRSLSSHPFHENSSLFPPPNLVDNLQGSRGGQILSLSLSPQQPLMSQQVQAFPMQHQDVTSSFFHGSVPDCKEGILSHKSLSAGAGAGIITNTFTSPSCDNFGASYPIQPPNNVDNNSRQINMFGSHFIVGTYQSKYLKPAQDLLNEVVNVGKPVKSNNSDNNNSNNSLKRSWMTQTTSIMNDDTFSRDNGLSDVSDKTMISWSGKREGDSIATALPIQTMGISEKTTLENVELTSTERQELQAKRAKLIGMRDEVDRRYKQYYHQMQAVVASFESTGGLGAATAYTCLALQTISKHFRCLRDAITRQIALACKALGDEDVSGGLVKGETSKLRLIGQQLRQQRALRQLGMMQQQAWRPQRGLPEHSVSILRAWLFENFLNPYPKDADKILLARQTGLSRNQVSNWFINARVRLWKPMVEEMYLEETKEAEAEGADRSIGDEGEGSQSMTTSEMNKPPKQAKRSCENHHDEGKELSSYPAVDMLQGKNLDGSSSLVNLLFHDKEGIIRQGVINSKHVLQDASSLLSPGLNNGGVSNADEGLEHEMKVRTTDEEYRETSAAGQNGYMQSDHLNIASYGSYPINPLNRYSQDSFPGSYQGGSGGISLTLGLQHCEGKTSFSGSYGQDHTHVPTNRQEESGTNVGSVDYYNMNDNSFESLGLQNRKPFSTHMLRHDFVV